MPGVKEPVWSLGPQAYYAQFALQAPASGQAWDVHEAHAEEKEVSARLHAID